ncbi:MAG: hypothetical protein A3G18_04355 [Rhodospirillales bacterium RIFCSPLOWO2_12_FULL_58_28]|nr:MAG: hypothetical protein A3H92_02545 [Rhodospirillales bacterium RIFCSPLOWO2_02_FULL_58_16]OHC77391.1 MAG: hypothetical protein A3G18_04355 [Rhodospirillales bacterium RIFCSPLOWO2_12_FULL_58_28]
MTDNIKLPDPLPVAAALPCGSAVILRHYDAPDRSGLAHELAALCRRKHLRLLVAGDARLALAVGAAGLHLPEKQARQGPGTWQAWRRPDWIVTAAAHSPAALRQAARIGADAALLSPVFESAGHSELSPLGPLLFAAWRRSSPLPVYALGGVSAATAPRLSISGCCGLAAIDGLASPCSLVY